MTAEEENYCNECGTTVSELGMLEMLQTRPMILIGEMKERGVYWSGMNPHCWPIGTKIYVQPPKTEKG